jgi:hypothetical protein
LFSHLLLLRNKMLPHAGDRGNWANQAGYLLRANFSGYVFAVY